MEQKVMTQLGDSCVFTVRNYLRKEFKENSYPPPHPTILSNLLSDTANARIEFHKFDTLGYPLRFSVINFYSKIDTLSLQHYYREYDRQNEIRRRYICENITINDTFQTPTSALINKVLLPTEIASFKHDLNKLSSVAPKSILDKPRDLCWNHQDLKRKDEIIKDLRPTRIKFFRPIFNNDFTKGRLLINYDVPGVLTGYVCFEIENKDSKWDVRTEQWFVSERNKKRWHISRE